MMLFKCKMCGGELEVEQGASVGVCKYCGSKQTLPKLDDERRTNLYDRANHFRRSNEFDKAAGIYEQILNEEPGDSEAYWSLVLCEYGVEYVEDPQSKRRVPTVHRAQFTSVFDNENYKSALEHADIEQRAVYEAEAREINEIQKGILAISQKEEPFDVFICYKETDKDGKRTNDSVLANDLYHQLTQEGFKVFFARITLEEKLGTEYEPYIFAALNSAKVMVVLGTKPEYFNAVWVKNEWSRFLSLIKKSNGQKMLIPAYRDMDPYDLPEEFSHLQAQDMSKLGFMQDLVRGIKKITGKDGADAAVKEKEAVSVDPLLKRVFIFLEDGNWREADVYCEKVLDLEPENAYAYLGKLMAELRVGTVNGLADCAKPFDDRPNYEKTIRYGDDKLVDTLRGIINGINERNEHERVNRIYVNACSVMNNAARSGDFEKAASMFASITGFEKADEYAKECKQRAVTASNDELYTSGISLMLNDTISDYENAVAYFKQIPGWKDADERIAACNTRLVELREQEEIRRRDTAYDIACSKMYSGEHAKVEEAIAGFESIPGWKDADQQAQRCKNRLVNLRLKNLISERTGRCDELAKKTSRKSRTAGLVLKTLMGLIIFAALIAVVIVVLPKINVPMRDDYTKTENLFVYMIDQWPLKVLVIIVSLFPLFYSLWTITRIARSGKEVGFSHSVTRVKNELLQIKQTVDADDTAKYYSPEEVENVGKTYTAKLDELERKFTNGPKNAMYGVYKTVSVICPAVFSAFIGVLFILLIYEFATKYIKNGIVALVVTGVAAVAYVIALIVRFKMSISSYATRFSLFVIGVGTPIIGGCIAGVVFGVLANGITLLSIIGGLIGLAVVYGIWRFYNWVLDKMGVF